MSIGPEDEDSHIGGARFPYGRRKIPIWAAQDSHMGGARFPYGRRKILHMGDPRPQHIQYRPALDAKPNGNPDLQSRLTRGQGFLRHRPTPHGTDPTDECSSTPFAPLINPTFSDLSLDGVMAQAQMFQY